jgi:hypothetical protein
MVIPLFNFLTKLNTFQVLIVALGNYDKVFLNKLWKPNLTQLKQLLFINDIYSALNIYEGYYDPQIRWLLTN